MFDAALIYAVLFLLVGPVRLIVPYARLAADFERASKWKIALVAAAIAAGLCVFVVLAGGQMLKKYDVALESLRVAGGLLLTVSALKNIVFPTVGSAPSVERPTVFETGLTVATPAIVGPLGIAAILLFSAAAPDAAAARETVLIPVLGLMAANLVVMLLIDKIMKIPGLKSFLYFIAAVLSLVQLALGVDVMLTGLGITGS